MKVGDRKILNVATYQSSLGLRYMARPAEEIVACRSIGYYYYICTRETEILFFSDIPVKKGRTTERKVKSEKAAMQLQKN